MCAEGRGNYSTTKTFFHIIAYLKLAFLNIKHLFSSVQSLGRVQLFTTPWTTARQASLSISNSKSSIKLTSIESVMPSTISSVVPRPCCWGLFRPPVEAEAWGGQVTCSPRSSQQGRKLGRRRDPTRESAWTAGVEPRVGTSKR